MRLIYDPEEKKLVKSRSKYFVEIQSDIDDTSRILDVGKPLTEDREEFAAQLRGNDQPFVITADTFEKLFENLERLAEPPEEAA